MMNREPNRSLILPCYTVLRFIVAPLVKIHWQNLKIFFYRTIGPISTKLSKKHPWVKRIEFVQMERHTFLTFGDNNKIAKVHSRNLKSSSPGLLGQFYNIFNHNFLAQMYSLIWTDFSGEWCGPWASCYIKCHSNVTSFRELVFWNWSTSCCWATW